MRSTRLILHGSQLLGRSDTGGARHRKPTVTFPPDPFPDSQQPSPDDPVPEVVEAWRGTELPQPESVWNDPVFLDGLRRLELMEQAKNLRLRMEADLDRAWSAGRRQDRAGEWSYRQRAIWNIRAAHRLQMEAGDGLVPADPVATPSFDSSFSYWGFLNTPSRCRVRVFEPHNQPLVVLATELPDNPGTSITNFAEQLATQVGQLLAAPLETLVWIEHYPERGTKPHERESFSLVSFTRTPHGLSQPRWRHLDRAEVEAIIGGELPGEATPSQGSQHDG